MALRPLNSVGGFSVGEIPDTIIDSNGNIAGYFATFEGNVAISNATASWGILTDNLYYSNGQPWDLQEAAGSNNQIQFNSNNDFSASANLTFDPATNLLTVIGNSQFNNANLGNLATANYVNVASAINLAGGGTANLGNLLVANFANIASNTVTNNLTVNADISGNTANFSGNITALNANLGNLSKANFFQGDGGLLTNVSASGTLANGTSNVTIPVASGNVNTSVGGAANVFVVTSTGANVTGTFNASGNANVNNIGAGVGVFTGNISALNASLGNLATANFVNVATNVNVTGTMEAGNVRTDNLLHANGNPWDFQQPAGSNTEIQYNDGNGGFGASANFTYNDGTQILALTGVANISQHIHVPNIQASGNLDVSANGFTTVFDDTGNVSFSANAVVTAKTFVGNVEGNIDVPASNTTVLFSDDGNVNGTTGFTFNKTSNLVGMTGNLDLGPAAKNHIVNVSNTSVEIRGGYGEADLSKAALLAGNVANNTDWGRIRIEGNVAGNSAAITEANVSYFRSPGGVSNIVTVNALAINSTTSSTGALVVAGGIGASGNVNVGGSMSVTGNIANANNISATNTLFANAANITANLTAGNANLGNLAIANFVQTADVFNGNSNVRIAANGNVSVSATGASNVLVVSSSGANVVGYVQANGNGSFGALLSPTLTSNSGALTLTAEAGNNNVVLVPTGTGNVDVSSRHIVQLADPTNAQDAATKAYVDSVATGLQIHPAVNVTSVTNLNATYANGGTSLTTIAISGGKTIQFSGAHGLSVDDEIYWNNTFNGITAQNGYFVETTPASDTITVRATYTGAEVTGLTNGTGLSQAALANPGVGATLTNAGANAAISIDGVALSSTNRVLVQGQTNQFENGVYTVTTVGNGSTAWVLTRATDADQYAPSDVGKLGYGDYFFITSGSGYAGSSYVLTTPTGEIVFGITNIEFSQFAAAGSYSAGNGIAINGTIISANVDGVTTDIVGGNIVVKTSAQLTTPNIGAATGTSVTLTGNVLANNVNANTLLTAPNAELTGNLLVNNVNANANITSNNATVNLALTGNTANFSSNVVVNNLTVNLELDGNTANFSGNVYAEFVQVGAGTPIPNLTNPVLAGTGDSNNFIQIYVHNDSNGTVASSDFIAYPNNGDDFTGWIDMGITSENFDSADYSVTEENEGYIFMSSPDLSGTSGNMVFATDSTGSNNSFEWFVGGFDQAKGNRAMLLDTTGLTVKGNLNVGNLIGTLANGNSNVAIPTANGNVNISVAGNANVAVVTGTGLVVTGNTKTTGVSGTGIGAVEAGVTNTILPNTVASFSANSNSYVQLTLQNKSALSDATSDFIATADNGSDTVNYVDVGIIGSGYDNNSPTNSLGNIVFPADSYMYAQGNTSNAAQSGGNLALGTTVPGKTVKIFAGGSNNAAIVATISNTAATITGNVLPNANVTYNLGATNQRWKDVYTANVNASGNVTVTGNLSANTFTANTFIANTAVEIGNTTIFAGEVTTTSITADQTISTVPVSGVTGVEWLVKGVDSTGAKYSMAMVTAVTDGANADFSTFGTVNIGSSTGTLSVNIVGSNIALQVTPSSSNSTVWVTQYRTL